MRKYFAIFILMLSMLSVPLGESLASAEMPCHEASMQMDNGMDSDIDNCECCQTQCACSYAIVIFAAVSNTQHVRAINNTSTVVPISNQNLVSGFVELLRRPPKNTLS